MISFGILMHPQGFSLPESSYGLCLSIPMILRPDFALAIPPLFPAHLLSRLSAGSSAPPRPSLHSSPAASSSPPHSLC